ncbi:hypothetical protein C7974DRAFT_321843 [Boeremia exigua]|uniref:uncharacterized protein n=1 Tax=Boeremia exigua TaxID=749465 RepID=UPI001E8D84CA|nr:uncharacterized protein C7974DRAFT_321843 [Boeremia exigua]KAH6614110.1 hypothetical protein C7974DRAFT_321843 [Boeremia exigua]
MAPRKQQANSRASSPEFPILEANGLYPSNIRGDGNCLFNALSDQLYGNQEMHAFLRDATIEHMRDNSEFYRQYMAVNNLRRNPKRTTTAAQPTRIDTTYYTEEQLQLQFEEHVEKMGQPGEWADNMEVSAFASALNVHVRLWQGDYTYVFSPRLYYSQNDDLTAEDDRRTLHIAYHTWEHYSSVRNTAGPHTGEPDVKFNAEGLSKKRPSPSVDGENDDQASRAQKRRSPLHLFDSDSTPEGSETSSDESSGVMSSFQQSQHDVPRAPGVRAPKLTLKLRCLRTSDPTPSPALTRSSTPAPLTPASTGTTPVPSIPPSTAQTPLAPPVAAKTSLCTQLPTPTTTPALDEAASSSTVTS